MNETTVYAHLRRETPGPTVELEDRDGHRYAVLTIGNVTFFVPHDQWPQMADALYAVASRLEAGE